jgi:hypothetical protein
MSAYPFPSAYPFGQQGGYQAQQNNYQQYGNAQMYQQQSPQVMNPAIAVNQGNMQDERIWVPSAAAAEAYPIAANGFVRLWHSTQPVFYEKSADAAGRPFPMIAYEYKLMGAETEQQSPTVEIPDFEPRFKALEERLEALEKAGTSNTNNNGNSKKEDNRK